MDVNPEYLEEKNQKLERWRMKAEELTSESLDFIRGFIPPKIFTYSESQFKGEAAEWPAGLIKRIWQKKVLWLTRLSRVDIERLHEADLYNKYNFQGQGLDLTEIAALYAAVPPKFWNDPSGRKNAWRATLEKTLQDMMEQDENGKLPASKKKTSLYKAQHAIYGDRNSLFEFEAVSGKDALNPRTSFKEMGVNKANDDSNPQSEKIFESQSATASAANNPTKASPASLISARNKPKAETVNSTKPTPLPQKNLQVDPNMKLSIAQALQQKMKAHSPMTRHDDK
jgi:hypothetical protein